MSTAPLRTTTAEVIRTVRRRLLVIVAAVLIGAGVGWFSAPAKATGPTTYTATTVLLYSQPSGYNLDQLALMATAGPVPTHVAARLHLDRDRVRALVSATTSPDVSTVSITAHSSDAGQAEALATATGEELIVVAGTPARSAYNAKVQELTSNLDLSRERVVQLQQVIAAGGPTSGLAVGALTGAENDVNGAALALQRYEAENAPTSPLSTLEPAASAAVRPTGLRTPDTKPARAGLLGGIGLLLGVGAAFVLSQFDGRIRTKRVAESAFGAPVIAEVPPIKRAERGRLLAVTQPSSPVVEAYRNLRTLVALWAGPNDPGLGRVFVVTSPLAGEGKTTSVAHLAAMLAEVGRSVLVVSADFRRPRLHLYFGRPQEPGLTEVLSGGPDAPTVADLDLSTSVRGVRLLSSGAHVANPSPILERAGGLFRAARGLYDFVLVDTPPALIASDAGELARFADGVLFVARAGRTTVDAAGRTAELIRRLDAPVVGTVLVGVESSPGSSHYYRYRYYGDSDRRTRGTQRPKDSSATVRSRTSPEVEDDRARVPSVSSNGDGGASQSDDASRPVAPTGDP